MNYFKKDIEYIWNSPNLSNSTKKRFVSIRTKRFL